MKLSDFMAQLEASAELTVSDDVEVVVIEEDGEDYGVYEVSYNSIEGRIDILLFDRNKDQY